MGVLAVNFQDLNRWNVSYFKSGRWYWPIDQIKSVREFTEPENISISVSDAKQRNIPIISKINFAGELFLRPKKDYNNYKGCLFLVQPGRIIFSKINARRGCILYVTEKHGELAVSGEYPVLRLNTDLAVGEYVNLALRVGKARAELIGSAAGMAKARTYLNDFQSIEIPLPLLEIQRAIVTYWQKGQDDVVQANGSLRQVTDDLNHWLYSHYYNNTKIDVFKSRVMSINWAELDGWDMKSARAAAFRSANQDFQPLSDFAEEATEPVKVYAEPEKKWAVYGVNNREGVFFSHMQKGKEFKTAYKKIHKNWFFHNPTRSSVGSLGIVPEIPENAVTSPEYQVWRIKQGLIPGFVATLIGTPFFISQIQFHRVGAVKQRLYVENLLKIRIPVVPDHEQQRIAEAREKALTLVARANQMLKKIEGEIEELILGTKKLS